MGYLDSAGLKHLWSNIKKFGGTNPNLSINSYWAAKSAIINQCMQDEYIGPGYSIEDWYLRGNTKMQITDDGIILEFPEGASGINQGIEFPEALLGKTFTASILIDENTVDSEYPRFGVHYANSVGTHSSSALTTYFNGTTGLISVTGVIRQSGYTGLNFGMYNAGAAGRIKIRGMKLELGPQQTLAHQDTDGNWVLNDPPPNKALELLKCQRYFVRAAGGGRACGCAVPGSGGSFALCTLSLPSIMRANPAINFNGLALYGGTKSLTTSAAVPIESISVVSITGNLLRFVAYVPANQSLEVGCAYAIYFTRNDSFLELNSYL